MATSPWLIASERLAAPTGVGRWHDDPAGFAQHCIDWGEGEGPTHYQLTVLRQLHQHSRVAVRSPHGAGPSLRLLL